MSKMRQVGNTMALLEQDDLSDRGILKAREEIPDRYIRAARSDPWTPPTGGGIQLSIDGWQS